MQGAGDSAFVGHNKLFPFSTVVFTSWDYHLTDVKAARNLRNSIRNQLAEMVFDAELADAYISKSTRITSLLLKARLRKDICMHDMVDNMHHSCACAMSSNCSLKVFVRF